jgi:hypothetical protein
MAKKPMWTLVPVGKAMLMVTAEVPLPGEEEVLNKTVTQLTAITGIPWFFMGDTTIMDETTMKEIAERYYGIKR